MADLNVMQPKMFDALNTNRSTANQAPQDLSSTGKEVAFNGLNQTSLPRVEMQDLTIEKVEKFTRPAQIEAALETAQPTEIDQVMSDLNGQMAKIANYLRFEKDADSDKMVVFIKNSETNEIIRQIPTQEFLAISKNINQYLEMRQSQSQPMATPTGLFTREIA